MKRFIEGIAREQATLFPERLQDWIDGDNPRVDRNGANDPQRTSASPESAVARQYGPKSYFAPRKSLL